MVMSQCKYGLYHLSKFQAIATLGTEKQVRNYSEFTQKRIAKKTGP